LQLSVAREEEYIDVFLIDPLLAGDEIIAVDLKPLLESTRVIKVIHDGRRDWFVKLFLILT
jgi:ribonuclease D